eukprot:symbB.v1.2.039060.t1/scaffold6325.1/size19000/1
MQRCLRATGITWVCWSLFAGISMVAAEELPRSTITKEAVQRFQASVRARMSGSDTTPDKAEDEWTSSEALRKDWCVLFPLSMENLARSRRGLLTFVVGGEPFEVPWPFLALHSPTWADKLMEDPELAKQIIELPGEAFWGGVGGDRPAMGSPYLVTTHRHFCRSCHREVDEDEIMVNEDELSVHLCGTVLDFEGLEVDDMGLAGQDLSTLECGADWFAEQRQLLAALQGTSRGEDVPGVSKKMRQQDAQQTQKS